MAIETEYARAERLPVEELSRQHTAWVSQYQTSLISNATPNLMLILNSYRQIVYANDQFLKFGNYKDIKEIIGLRPGEYLGCVNSNKTEGGCGTSRFCATCGAIKAVLSGLNGKDDVEEVNINRGQDLPVLQLRVWTTPVKLDGEDYTIFSLQDITLELEYKRLLEENKKLAVEDPLTGILNRRAFLEQAEQEFQRALRYQRDFSLVMIDYNDFKRVNDKYGHLTGDRVLIDLTRKIGSNLRDIDIFGRYGGDEFILVLSETSIEGARAAAKRAQGVVASTPILVDGKKIKISISAGVASLQHETDQNLEQIIHRSDEDLMDNKAILHKRRH